MNMFIIFDVYSRHSMYDLHVHVYVLYIRNSFSKCSYVPYEVLSMQATCILLANSEAYSRLLFVVELKLYRINSAWYIHIMHSATPGEMSVCNM